MSATQDTLYKVPPIVPAYQTGNGVALLPSVVVTVSPKWHVELLNLKSPCLLVVLIPVCVFLPQLETLVQTLVCQQVPQKEGALLLLVGQWRIPAMATRFWWDPEKERVRRMADGPAESLHATVLSPDIWQMCPFIFEITGENAPTLKKSFKSKKKLYFISFFLS